METEAPTPDHRVILQWVALCPVTPACEWRDPGHVAERFALDASRAHGETDTWIHEHRRCFTMPAVASIDIV